MYLLAILSIYKELCDERRKYGTTTIYKFGFKYHPKIVLQQCVYIFRPMQLSCLLNKQNVDLSVSTNFTLTDFITYNLLWPSEKLHGMVTKVLTKAKLNT